ncbi:MAG: DUF1015 domain-containing protein [Euryarchaeota archaeon]|jgi:uncharacterized protein (DUF1015 family)|nr:DUF1015 domain-containing protein [Euryarchaeota archaeon]
MVEIAPFKGMIYNTEKIKKFDDVMSPPYDIISEQMQNELYNKNEFNFVKLILGKILPDDTDLNNRYTRAKQLFDVWQQQKILIPSQATAIFPYKVDYTVNKEKKQMNGFFVLLKLDPDYKTVKAHEKTLAKPKADRLNLMRACYANLEPIQLMYMDQKDIIRKTMDAAIDTPLINVKGYDGFTHQLWRLDNTKAIQAILNELEKKILFIADGHHRYQTSINYAAEKREQTGNKDPNAPFNYIMVVLCNMFDPGLSILPTHRFIKMSHVNFDELSKKLEKYFIVEKKSITNLEKDYQKIGKKIMNDIKTDDKHMLAFYTKGMYYILTLKDEQVMDQKARDHSKTWRTLDVSILHKLILEEFLGITEKNLEDHVKYTRVDGEAIQQVDEGKYDFSFLINATKIDQLKAIADASEHMPQKSTYFLPKMLSGLVMYKM